MHRGTFSFIAAWGYGQLQLGVEDRVAAMCACGEQQQAGWCWHLGTHKHKPKKQAQPHLEAEDVVRGEHGAHRQPGAHLAARDGMGWDAAGPAGAGAAAAAAAAASALGKQQVTGRPLLQAQQAASKVAAAPCAGGA